MPLSGVYRNKCWNEAIFITIRSKFDYPCVIFNCWIWSDLTITTSGCCPSRVTNPSNTCQTYQSSLLFVVLLEIGGTIIPMKARIKAAKEYIFFCKIKVSYLEIIKFGGLMCHMWPRWSHRPKATPNRQIHFDHNGLTTQDAIISVGISRP